MTTLLGHSSGHSSRDMIMSIYSVWPGEEPVEGGKQKSQWREQRKKM